MDRMGHFRAHGLQHRRAASALLVGWCLSGCWYPWINYPHQYYGPGTLPPTMNGPIVPGGTYVPGTPNPLSPSSPGTTTPSNPAPTPNWRPENGTKTDAPPFRPNTGNQGVPFPNDDFGGTPPRREPSSRKPLLGGPPSEQFGCEHGRAHSRGYVGLRATTSTAQSSSQSPARSWGQYHPLRLRCQRLLLAQGDRRFRPQH